MKETIGLIFGVVGTIISIICIIGVVICISTVNDANDKIAVLEEKQNIDDELWELQMGMNDATLDFMEAVNELWESQLELNKLFIKLI